MLSGTRFEMFEEKSQFQLTVDHSSSCVGGFKTAYFGHIEPSPFKSKTRFICAKQAHQEDKQNDKMSILPSRQQLERLPDEMMTLQWSNALMTATYEQIARVTEVKLSEDPTWKPQMKVPDLCFTEAGLAVEQGDAGRAKVYMVEERIWGTFKKYIHNGSARLSDSARSDPVALFLSFSQHAQYIHSNGLAFVSDYQGGRLSNGRETILLTDPQLITHPALGNIFAGGNVSSSFVNFGSQHVCNSFCFDFELTPLHQFEAIPLEDLLPK
ncbi:hypothetical protein C8F01DRAFT_1066736 [Mycena amicta]|nr:hypothetical protein C8F01DRAFT_1066736 [Mycena amicta]